MRKINFGVASDDTGITGLEIGCGVGINFVGQTSNYTSVHSEKHGFIFAGD